MISPERTATFFIIMYFDYLRVTKITDFTPLPSQNSSNAGFLYSHLSRRNIWAAFCCVAARKTNKTNISPSRRNKTVDICCVAAEALRSAAQSSICEPPGDIFETVTQRIIQNSAGRPCFIHEFNNFTHRHSSNPAKLCRTVYLLRREPTKPKHHVTQKSPTFCKVRDQSIITLIFTSIT